MNAPHPLPSGLEPLPLASARQAAALPEATPPADFEWHATATRHGVVARAHFFDAEQVANEPDRTHRMLPLLARTCGARVWPADGSSARRVWRAAGLSAQPELVLAHGDGLVAVTLRRSIDGPLAEAGAAWIDRVRPETLLFVIASAMVVGGQSQQLTAAVWRCQDAVVQVDPSPTVLECLAFHLADARRHFGVGQGDLSAAQLAQYCAPRLLQTPGLAAGL